MSSGTRGKIQNFGFFWSKSGKFLPFLADFGIILAVFGVQLQFWSLVLAENFQKSTSKFFKGK